MQWMVPGRVGEMHDVGLNAVAVVCGLLFSTGVHPPRSLAFPRNRASRLALVRRPALFVAVAGFVDRVHLGYEVHDGRTVRSIAHDARELSDAATNRAARWNASPPPQRGFSREDHYLTGELYVARRNTAVGTGDWEAAWGENSILERFYAPVLDRLGRWSIEQKTEIQQSVGGRAESVCQCRAVSDLRGAPVDILAGDGRHRRCHGLVCRARGQRLEPFESDEAIGPTATIGRT